MSLSKPFRNKDIVIDWRTVGAFMTNSHLLVCPHTKEAALFDASGEAPKLRSMIEEQECQFKYYFQTHAHLDHVAALSELKAWNAAPILLHPEENMLYDNLPMQCQLFGLPPLPTPPPVDQWIKEGDVFQVGALTVRVWDTPGHTPGGVSFLVDTDDQHFLFSGDTLFAGSIGRTDLPGGDMRTLQTSLKRLLTLPDDTFVFTGHGPPTTIGRERQSNPFLQM